MKEEKTNPGLLLDKLDMKELIGAFLSNSKNLSFETSESSETEFSIVQKYDRKSLFFSTEEFEKVLEREDSHGENFLQINFKNGKKIILTEDYIGFSPAVCVDFDSQLPKVVTTVDLLNVIDAIEGTVYGTEHYQESLSDVKLFFEAIASGAESIGFDLTGERLWIEKIITRPTLN